MEFEDIFLERSGGVAVITFNRPDTLNSFGGKLLKELPLALEAVQSDDDVRVVVLTGAGRGFCSGADVNALRLGAAKGFSSEADLSELRRRLGAAQSEQQGRREALQPAGWFGVEISQVEKPTIAAVNGPAVGGGFAIAMACDVRIASERAVFGPIWTARYGLVPEGGSSYFLPRILGLPKALEMILLGETIDAAEASRIGLVNRVVPHEKLMETVLEMAHKIASRAPIAVELSKKLLYRGANTKDVVSQVELESELLRRCLGTEDFREGLIAFVEKRAPDFKGR